MVRREIGALEAVGSKAAEQLRSAQALYLSEVKTAAKLIPTQIDIIDRRLSSTDTRLYDLDRRADTLAMDIQVVAALRKPLTRIAAHLDDPFLRSRISIATVLGNAGWLVVVSFVFSIAALVFAVIAVRVLNTELKDRARREDRRSGVESATSG